MAEQFQHTLQVGQRAFQHFQHGLATGDWQGFLAMLTDDFTFWFPIGEYHGLNVGKDRAREFFHYVNDVFQPGLTLMLDRVTSNETTVVFEFRDQGLMRGQPYKNRIAVSFDVRGEQICGYREYLGSDGKSN
ncbi:MAG TPA: nuclear transport factor 2 family protein [Microcoleaceae cyanobacterium]|jgi:ketosteroid isomerase-like protein